MEEKVMTWEKHYFIYLLIFLSWIANADVSAAITKDSLDHTHDHFSLFNGLEPLEQIFAPPNFYQNLTANNHKCKIRPADEHIYDKIVQLQAQNLKILEYSLIVVNNTENPLLKDAKWTYKLNQWARVSHSHGQTILSLAFNYGVLSLMTLTFGIAAIDVKLVEEPPGCLLHLNEEVKIETLLDPLLRDFRPDGKPSFFEGHMVCNQVIKNISGYAKFTDQCCYTDPQTRNIHCITDPPNMWLDILQSLMTAVGLIVILFGPLASSNFLSGAGLEVIQYVVKLKEPLFQTLCVFDEGNAEDHHTTHNHAINLRSEKRFQDTKEIIKNLPTKTLIPIKISEYNISVSYEKLLPENNVPVGFWACLIRAIFMCKMQNTEAFQDCCDANLCGCIRESRPITWISVCRVLGRVLMVVFLPFPFYIRVILYYMFEEPEVMDRLDAAENAGLPMLFEYRILQYLTPTHPLFLSTYAIYYLSGITMAAFSATENKSKFQRVISKSFSDIKDFNALAALGMVVRNFLWPFKKLGVFGFFLGLIYWPIIMPISIFAACFNCLPIIFLTIRILFHALGISDGEKGSNEQTLPGELRQDVTGISMFEADTLFSSLSSDKIVQNVKNYFKSCHVFATMGNLVLAVISIITFYVVTLMVCECVHFILSICVFTMMGIIVNAGKVLKYGALIFMVVLYSYDCYNNVYLQYLKLNKALFSEIKGRIKDLWEVTMLPSYLQENRGFKSQENSDQADHETGDELYGYETKQWQINDLILFIDNNDVPRIPKKLFEEVCDIEVPGSPGPVYRSLIKATGKFFLIILFLIFVFIVVLSFGDVYKISSTNQMLATMAGGFMPFVFSNLLKPAQPAIELGSVSFKSKLEEIVINFKQIWPMYDFRFDIEEEPESQSGSDSEGDDEKGDQGKDKSKKDEKNGKDKDKKDKKKDTCPRHSMADLLDEGDELPTKDEILKQLMETKTYRPADGQFADIVMYVDKFEDVHVSSWSIGPVSESYNGKIQSDSTYGQEYPIGNFLV